MHKVKHKDSIDCLINMVMYINLLVLLSIVSARKHKDKHETNSIGIARFGPIIDPSTIEYIDLEQVDEYFKHFNLFYGADYRNQAHYARSKARFIDNVKRVLVMNKFAAGVQFRINEFANLTLVNFTKTHTGFNDTGIHHHDVIEFVKTHGKKYPKILDWRTLGLNHHVKHQGSCKSSYVFSAVANIAAQYARAYGFVPLLSEQQGFNCANGTCKTGGMPHQVLQALQNAGGVVADTSTPYDRYEPADHKLACEVNPTYAIVSVTKVIRLEIKYEDHLIAALDTYGPLITAIYVSESVKHYHSGVLDPSDCNKNPNHNVLLVGYGVSEDRVPFWILMNSWGTMWGEQGFLRLVRGKQACNIGLYLATATVEKYMPSLPATQMDSKKNYTSMATTPVSVFKNRAHIQEFVSKSSDSSSDSSSTEETTINTTKKLNKKAIPNMNFSSEGVKEGVRKGKFLSTSATFSSTEDKTITDKVKIRASKVNNKTEASSDEYEQPQKKEEKYLEPHVTAMLEKYTKFKSSNPTDYSSVKTKTKKKRLRTDDRDDHKMIHELKHKVSTDESPYESSNEKSDKSEFEGEEEFPEAEVAVLRESQPEVRVTKGIWGFMHRL